MRIFVKDSALVEQIVALNRVSFHGTERAPDDVVRDIIKTAAVFARLGKVAYEGVVPLYGAALITEKFGEPYVWSVAVHENWRGMGTGGALLEEAACYARELPATGISLTVNADNASAQRLYLTLGYRVMRFLPRYYGTNGDGLLMRRPL